MKIKILIVFIFTLFFLNCKNNLESINKKDVLNTIERINSNQINKNKLLDSLYIKLLTRKNDSIKRNLLFKIGNIYYYDNNLEKYLETVIKIKELSIVDKDSSNLAKSLYYIGDYYDDKNSLEEAYKNYYQSEKIYYNLNDSINIGKVKLKKAGILFDNGNFNESEIEIIKTLKLLLNKNEDRLVYSCYNMLALNLKELKNYSKSLIYFNLAQIQLNKLGLKDTTNIKFSKSTCLNNIGNVYIKMGQFNNAAKFYQKGLSTENLKLNKPGIFAMLLSNLAYTKLMSKNPNGVKEMLFESYKIRDSLKMNLGIISSKYYIGQYYLFQKDTLKAIENVYSCYSLSKKIKSAPDVLNSLKLLTEIDTKNKNFYTNEYFRINDSLQQAERATRNKFARIEFETDQVEEENSILIKKNSYIIIGSFILFFIIGTLFILYRLKTKNKELKLIQDQQIKNEEIYQLLLKQQSISEESRKEERNRIAMELHDGVVNSVFTTRFNLMQLESNQIVEKDSIIKELEKTEAEIRRVAHELNLTLNFKDESILNMITNLVEAQKNEWNTQFVVKIDDFIDWNTIEVEIKMNAYRIIQEALQNVNKYSKAKQCIVMLLKTENKTTIRIWDNGIGFNPKKNKKGIGLKNIQERALTMNASLTINSKINNGTSIEIIF